MIESSVCDTVSFSCRVVLIYFYLIYTLILSSSSSFTPPTPDDTHHAAATGLCLLPSQRPTRAPRATPSFRRTGARPCLHPLSFQLDCCADPHDCVFAAVGINYLAAACKRWPLPWRHVTRSPLRVPRSAAQSVECRTQDSRSSPARTTAQGRIQE